MNPNKKTNKKLTSFDKAAQIASFYGFMHAPDLTVTGVDERKAKSFKDAKKSLHGNVIDEKIALMRGVIDKAYAHLPQPLMLYYGGPRTESSYHMFNIEIVGNTKSIADALVIEGCYVIAKDVYPEYELCVYINTVGDHESIMKYGREVQNFIKKNSGVVPSKMKIAAKSNPYEFWKLATSVTDEKFTPIKPYLPTTLGFLSEDSKKHFKEVLEYLEVLKIPYSLEHAIMGARGLSAETVFHIEGTKKKGEKTILAYGGRANGLSRKAWGKKEIAEMYGVVMLPDACRLSKIQKSVTAEDKSLSCGKNNSKKRISFFFMQLGFDAKLKSLQVLELLRVAGIPIHQSLSKDKTTGQIEQAEKMGITHLIIMGKKEAMENSVCIRDMETRVQVSVPIPDLTNYIAKIRK